MDNCLCFQLDNLGFVKSITNCHVIFCRGVSKLYEICQFSLVSGIEILGTKSMNFHILLSAKLIDFIYFINF